MAKKSLPSPRRNLDRFVENAAPGRANTEVRKVVKAVIELAQAVKHQSAPTRRDAGIAADPVIQLANILRRLDTTRRPPRGLRGGP